MEPFSTAVLTKLSNDLTVGVVKSLGGALKRQVSGTAEQQALEHSLRAGVVALVAQASAATPEEEQLLASIFEEFFHHPQVWVQIVCLLQGKPLDHELLRDLFADPDTGYDLRRLEKLDFDAALDAFAAAFLISAKGQKNLAHIIQTGLLDTLADGQEELIKRMADLVAKIDTLAKVSVDAGNVVDAASSQTVWNVGKYVAADEVIGPKFELSGQFPGIVNIISIYGERGGNISNEIKLKKQITDYLIWLRDDAGKLRLLGIEREGRRVLELPLETVYVPLEAKALPLQHKHHEAMAEPVDIRMDQVMPLGQRLVIIGGPGSGKTTVLRYIASMLATALVSPDEASDAREKLGLAKGNESPLPLFVPLSRFAGRLQELDLAIQKGTLVPADSYTLANFVAYYLGQNQSAFGLSEDFFAKLLEEGRQIILLLDGLDEIPDESYRVRVAASVDKLAMGRPELKVIVTCRTAAYKDKSTLKTGFREIHVKPLEERDIANLITQVYKEYYRADPRTREDKTNELLTGIDNLEEERRRRLGNGIERLVTSPLMVRMLLIVHLSERRKLPDQRADLFIKVTNVLLNPDYAPDADQAIAISRLVGGENMHRDLTQYLAFKMHSLGEIQDREIEEDQLRAILGEESLYVPFVDDFITLTRLRGTLLEERFGMYRFIHHAFQEFLAARYLCEVVRSTDSIADFLEGGPILDTWWREVALLVGGYLTVLQPTAAIRFLRRLAGLDADAVRRSQGLSAGTQMSAIEIAALSVLEWQTDQVDLRRDVTDRLATLLIDERLTVPNPLRAAAGRALGRLGDPREDVSCDVPATVRIPAGPFIMGSVRRKNRPGYDEMAVERESMQDDAWFELHMPAYKIGKYPVTVGQYRLFVEDGGYNPEKSGACWRGGGLEWLKKSGQQAPRYWDDPQWTVDNHPVAGVTWYEAVAYCEWLKARTGRHFRLPDEAMWEKAARGTKGRRWPWEGGFDKAKLNSGEGGIGRMSAVGTFPAGKSPFGVHDCAGNVWEWCSGPGYREAKYPLTLRPYEDDLKPSAGTRALRGGSWNGFDQVTRAAFRGLNVPDSRGLNYGFRVVELLSDADF